MLKKAWLTDQGAGLATLTLESSNVLPEHQRVSVYQRTFPAKDPEHHVTVVGLLSEDDLMQIQNAIKEYLRA